MEPLTFGSSAQAAQALAFVALLGAPTWAQTSSGMLDLGTLGQPHSSAQGISADGSVIVGWSGPSPFGAQPDAFRWTAAGGMTSVVIPGSSEQSAESVSADGTVVVGSRVASGGSGFRWTASGGVVGLWGPGRAASQDGSTVVGYSDNAAGGWWAYRWTALGGIENLGLILGAPESQALGVSSDGSIVVGYTKSVSGIASAFRYSATTGAQSFGLGGSGSVATATSADGGVVAGYSAIPGPIVRVHAFRWVAASGIQDLGTLGGNESRAWGVSSDGAVVVGEAQDAVGRWRAFRWSASTGMQDLGTLGGTDSKALCASADGSLIAGSARTAAGAWHAVLYVQGSDCDGNGVPDALDVLTGAAFDCNDNGVPDSCDIASGTSQDLDGDGLPDECICLSGTSPSTYCTAKPNSQLCLPAIAISATPSVSNTGSCLVTATNVLNNRNGLLFYGYQSASQPFQGRFLCVQPPLRRTAVQSSGGSSTGTDCSGAFSFDMNAHIASGIDPLLLVVGQSFACQYWSRDPAASFGTSLTDAVRGHVCQ